MTSTSSGEQSKTCRRCGSQHEATVLVCPQCSEVLPEASQSNADSAEQTEQPRAAESQHDIATNSVTADNEAQATPGGDSEHQGIAAVSRDPNFSNKLVGGILGKAAVRLFVFPVFLLGFWVGGAGLHDPDTCWLAALGRIIFETGKLPATDPFSYTFALGASKPFIMYQWLTELIFYTCIHFGGLILLLTLAATTLYVAFVCLPLISFDKLNLPRLRSFGLILLAMTAASFHFLVRPEIFSYLMLSIWLSVMALMRQEDMKTMATQAKATIDWKIVGSFCALMVIWCNLHTGCTSGLIVLSVYFVFSSLEWAFLGRKAVQSYPYKTAATALIGSLVCTLANPNGINLWTYIPLLFFSPINKYIVELRPVGLSNFLNPEYFPFYLLSLISAWDCAQAFRTTDQSARPGWFPPIFIATLLVLGFQHSRLIPFSALCLIYEDAWLRSQYHRGNAAPSTIGDFANARMKELFSLDARWLIMHGILVVCGVLLISTTIVKPRLPQGSQAFSDPTEVLEYMKQNPLRPWFQLAAAGRRDDLALPQCRKYSSTRVLTCTEPI